MVSDRDGLVRVARARLAQSVSSDPDRPVEAWFDDAVRREIGRVAARHGIATSAAAVAWTLAWPGVTGAIVGAKNPQQLDSWLNAGDVELQDEDLELVALSIRDSGAGTGPASPAVRSTAG